jgi:hypothetical protein
LGKDKRKLYDQLIDEVLEWSCLANPKNTSSWLKFAARYMKFWGWNQAAITDFLVWGKHGFNNDLFHKSTPIESFYGEVEYSSDRMSLDRLFRCHVKYQTLEK